jgi:predicted nucleotidyltransferase
MPKLVRVNIERLEEYYEGLTRFVRELKATLPVEEVWLHGSFARGEVHEGSDIDLIIVGDFKERFHERIGRILALTDLPIEPLVYTRQEFEAMKQEGNPLIKEVLATGKAL